MFVRFRHSWLILALLFAAVPTAPALAWSAYGHETVARIALANVRPTTRAAIARLLRHQALLGTPSCPAHTLAQASVWPDCVKGLGERFRYQFFWHFQNVELCQPFDLAAACRDGNCVSAQIDRQARLLKDKTTPPNDRVMALVLLTHFVGDLAQPLHGAERHDAGGNRVRARYGIVRNAHLNLHKVWDDYLAERAISTPPALVHRYAPAQRSRLAAGTTADWSRDSWEIARDTLYPTALGTDYCQAPKDAAAALNERDIEALIPLVRSQVVKGGLRLARLLDAALDPQGR